MAQQPDWFVAEWLEATGVKQTDLSRKFGWSKGKASEVCSGKQGYRREIVNQVAEAVGAKPFELLLPPEEAFAIRRWRDDTARIANSPYLQSSPAAPEPPVKPESVAKRRQTSRR